VLLFLVGGLLMNSKEFLNKANKKPEVRTEYDFIAPFLDFVKATLNAGCSCKRRQKEKLIEDRFQGLKSTTPLEVWQEMESFLNGS
tara:strand:- start:483 stop:740 length:258 start_codon:yes stop_codon:yes gene_type:complete